MITVDVVIPARDEAAALPLVLADLPRSAEQWCVRRIIVVDNGSRDDTAGVARAAGAEVVREPLAGYGRACLAGLATLRAAPPALVVFLDGDHSDDARELPRLLAPLLAGVADLVVGARAPHLREPGAFTPAQAFGNALASALLRLCWGASATDLGPFRAIRWAALERLGMRDRTYGWTVDMQARAFAAGMRVVEVPVSYRCRRLGRSKVSGTVRGVFGAGWKILGTLARVRLGH